MKPVLSGATAATWLRLEAGLDAAVALSPGAGKARAGVAVDDTGLTAEVKASYRPTAAALGLFAAAGVTRPWRGRWQPFAVAGVGFDF